MPGIPSIYYGGEFGIKGIKENNSDDNLRPCLDLDNIPDKICGFMSTLLSSEEFIKHFQL